MTQQTMFKEHDSDVRAPDVAAEEIGPNVPAEETARVGEEETRNLEEELEGEEKMETVVGEVVDDGDPATTVSNLYGDDAQVAALAERVMMVAPWVHYKIHGEPKKMTTKEVSLAIRRCMALGVDPLNPREIQIWRDAKGMHTQLAYTLMTQWIRNMHGGHSAPRYRPLSDEEREFRGLALGDHAVECTLIMRSDIPNIIALVQDAGFEPEEARDHFTLRGTATVDADDWQYDWFAPNGRSKQWKLEKRALVDCYRRNFGEPSRQEIEVLRRQRGDVPLLPEDFEGTQHLLPYDRPTAALLNAKERVRLTRQRADNGNGRPKRDPDEVLTRGREILRGSDVPQI